MEAAIVAALAEEGIAARSRCEEGTDYTGVWVARRKIASIGVHVSRGITTHGFAVNVENDLEPSPGSSPAACPTSDDLDRAGDRRRAARAALRCFRKRMADRFCAAHGRRQRLVSPGRLGIDTTRATRAAPIGAEPHRIERLGIAVRRCRA